METTQEESWDCIDSSKNNITVFSSDTSEVPKIKLSVNKWGIQTPTESSLMLREHFKNAKDLMLSSYLFKRKFKALNLQQVEVPGNRYCFLSSILIALGKTGVMKTFQAIVYTNLLKNCMTTSIFIVSSSQMKTKMICH